MFFHRALPQEFEKRQRFATKQKAQRAMQRDEEMNFGGTFCDDNQHGSDVFFFHVCIFFMFFCFHFGLPVSQTMGFATVAGGGSKQGKG